ncbi:hypothetical protein [Variovorax gossypii]
MASQYANQKGHVMTVLLSGVSMTMAGIAPSPDRASYLQTLLKRIEPAANICVDRVKSVLSSYASGSAPNRDILLEAGNEWRQNMAMLRDMRNGTDAPSEVDAGERPRA